MPVVKYREILEHIFRMPVFGPEDLQKNGVSKNYSKKLLHTLAKSGKVTRIERGKYTCLDDAVAVAPHITKPSYLSLWTAMSIRNLTAQIPFSVEVVTSRKRFKKKISLGGTEIIFYSVRPEMMFGYENMVWKENIVIPVANPEKIVVDAVSIGGIPEDEVLNAIKVSDVSLLKKYAKMSGSETESRIMELAKKCLRRKR